MSEILLRKWTVLLHATEAELETGEQPRDWILYKIIRKLENLLVIFNNAKQFEETKHKNETDPNMAGDFCSKAFRSKPYGYSFSKRPFLYGCGPALDISITITISLISGPLNKILSWPLKRAHRISIFTQYNFDLIWTNLLKTDDKTMSGRTDVRSYVSSLQPFSKEAGRTQ